MNEADEQLLRAMIEESGEMWMAVRGRVRDISLLRPPPIIICRDPERAWYLTRAEDAATEPLPVIGGWAVEERALGLPTIGEFFAAFGSHWHYWLGAIVRGAPIRAFIKNGRKEGWSISLDMKTEPANQELNNETKPIIGHSTINGAPYKRFVIENPNTRKARVRTIDPPN